MRRPDGSSEDSARPRLTSSDGPRPFHRAHHLRPVGEFLWADGPPSYAARLTRLRQWLASYGHDPAALPEPVLGVLAHADSGSEVRLVLALLRAGPWTAVGERTVSDGARSITLQAPIGPYRADFLVEEPEVAPFVVESGPAGGQDQLVPAVEVPPEAQPEPEGEPEPSEPPAREGLEPPARLTVEEVDVADLLKNPSYATARDALNHETCESFRLATDATVWVLNWAFESK